jgi:hypothetical protein
MSWKIEEIQSLNVSSLMALFRNEVAVLRMPAFLSPGACEELVGKILQHGSEPYTDDPEMARIGITQAEHMYDKRLYFARAAEANSIQEEIFKESRIILFLVMSALRAAWQGRVRVAIEEKSQQLYFAGVIRVLKSTKLHFDWAPQEEARELSRLRIGKTRKSRKPDIRGFRDFSLLCHASQFAALHCWLFVCDLSILVLSDEGQQSVEQDSGQCAACGQQ